MKKRLFAGLLSFFVSVSSFTPVWSEMNEELLIEEVNDEAFEKSEDDVFFGGLQLSEDAELLTEDDAAGFMEEEEAYIDEGNLVTDDVPETLLEDETDLQEGIIELQEDGEIPGIVFLPEDEEEDNASDETTENEESDDIEVDADEEESSKASAAPEIDLTGLTIPVCLYKDQAVEFGITVTPEAPASPAEGDEKWVIADNGVSIDSADIKIAGKDGKYTLTPSKNLPESQTYTVTAILEKQVYSDGKWVKAEGTEEETTSSVTDSFDVSSYYDAQISKATVTVLTENLLVFPNRKFEFTETGDGPSGTPADGDTRLIAANYTFWGTQNDINAADTSEKTFEFYSEKGVFPSGTTGNVNFTVNFRRQVYTKDAWTDVKDSNGNVVYEKVVKTVTAAKLLSGGTVTVIQGQSPKKEFTVGLDEELYVKSSDNKIITASIEKGKTDKGNTAYTVTFKGNAPGNADVTVYGKNKNGGEYTVLTYHMIVAEPVIAGAGHTEDFTFEIKKGQEVTVESSDEAIAKAEVVTKGTTATVSITGVKAGTVQVTVREKSDEKPILHRYYVTVANESKVSVTKGQTKEKVNTFTSTSKPTFTIKSDNSKIATGSVKIEGPGTDNTYHTYIDVKGVSEGSTKLYLYQGSKLLRIYDVTVKASSGGSTSTDDKDVITKNLSVAVGGSVSGGISLTESQKERITIVFDDSSIAKYTLQETASGNYRLYFEGFKTGKTTALLSLDGIPRYLFNITVTVNPNAFIASLKDVTIMIGGRAAANGGRLNVVLSRKMNSITFGGKGYNGNVKAVVGAERLVAKYWGQEGTYSKHTKWEIGSSKAVEDGTEFKIFIYFDRERYNGSSWVKTGTETASFVLVARDNKTAPVVTNVYNSRLGADIRWRKVNGAVGYVVYRFRSAEGTKKAATVNDVNTVRCYDSSIRNNCYGRVYSYYVKALYKENGKTVEGPASNKVILQRLAPMQIISASNYSAGRIGLKWKCTVNDNKAYGYEIQYATSSADLSGRAGSFRTVAVNGRSNLQTSLLRLTKGKTYWIRMRSYVIYTNSVTGRQTKTWSQYSNTVSVKVNK